MSIHKDLIVMDYNGFKEYTRPFFLDQLSAEPEFAKLVADMDLREYCQEVGANFKNRLEIYLDPNYDNILAKIIPIASKITEILSPQAIVI